MESWWFFLLLGSANQDVSYALICGSKRRDKMAIRARRLPGTIQVVLETALPFIFGLVFPAAKAQKSPARVGGNPGFFQMRHVH